MKTAIILTEGVKQIVFTPENDSEKFALSLITPNDDMELLIKNGSIGDNYLKPFTATVSECQSGFLRVFSDTDSRIIVFKPKKTE